MVMIKLVHKIATKRQNFGENSPVKWKCSDLQIPDIVTKYQKELDIYNETRNTTQNITAIEDMWADIKCNIDFAANNILEQERKKRNQWFDEECRIAIEMKNTARSKLIQRNTRASTNEYKTLRDLANKVCRRKKREFFKKKLKNLEDAQHHKDLKNFYEGVQSTKKCQTRPKATLIRDTRGQLVIGKEVANVWAEHFKSLLNPPITHEDQPPETDSEHIQGVESDTPTLEEISEAILKLKNNKATGIDNIPGELFKAGSDNLKTKMHKLISKIWEEEELPDDWKKVTLVPVYKKGDPLACSNYRGISLLCIAYKILALILYKRMVPFTERIIGDYQCGFRRNRSTIDHIFSMKQILEKNWEHGRTTYCLFIDFKTAYDSIIRENLWKNMKDLNIPIKIINMVRLTTANMKYLVKVGTTTSESFDTSAGLKQGDAIAPLLFNIVLETILRKAQVNMKKNIIRNDTQLLAYADDIVILTRNVEDMRLMFSNIVTHANEAGLEINERKTKIMISNRQSTNIAAINIQQYNFEVVQEFIYLGAIINPQNNTNSEIRRRITMGKRCVAVLHNLLKSRLLSRTSKLKMYKTLILPVVIYGSETWTIGKNDEEALLIFERQVLRKILGPIKEGDFWRARMNFELQQIYDSPNIIGIIKSRRLRWFGHLQRMHQDRLTQQVFLKTPIERRPPGRPKLRWLDNVKADIKRLDPQASLQTCALDRGSWKSLVEEAKVLFGL